MNRLADELLRGIQHRGEDATGYGFVTDGGDCRVQKACLKASDFIKERSPIPGDSRTVLLHTRYATNGSPAFPENNHPTIAGSVISVHNGVIWNDDKLFERVVTPRMGTVDSEAATALANHYSLDALDAFVESIEGSFALAFADSAMPGQLRLVRGYQSPLYVYQTDKLVVWASTFLTIKNAWAACFGTPPSLKSVECVQEGNVIAYDENGMIAPMCFTFEPANAWINAYTSQKSYGVTCNLPDPNEGLTTFTARCGICDSYTDDEDVSYFENMWICDDCMTFVAPETTKWDKVADEIMAQETESFDDDGNFDKIIDKYTGRLSAPV